MNMMTQFIISAYSRMLTLYPRRFRDEFGGEMQTVFSDSVYEASKDSLFSLAILCLREVAGLPFHVLWEFWHEFQGKETIMATSEMVKPESTSHDRTSHWDAFLSALPYAVFGIVCMVGKIRVPWVGIHAYMAFYFFVLLGLLIGLVKAFPRWAYSYLGWSLLFAWWWTNMYTRGLKIFGYAMGDEAWGWRAWAPLLIIVGTAILLTRSIRPLRELVLGIWQDWTLLSLTMYSFVGFMMLLYDEVRAPYTIAFMTASTLLISASVWIFMRSESHFHRLGILLGGFFTGLLMDRIVDATWDFNAYHGLPARPPIPWYSSLFEILFFTVLWSPIVWLPVLVGLFKSTFNKEPKT